MRFRVGVSIALLAIAASTIALVAGSATSGSPFAREGSEFQSRALQRHQELFGLGNREGPASYADQVAELNAFPDTTISAPEIAGAQAAARKNEEHGFGHGKHNAGQWVSLGPTKSVYPASLNRHGSEYVASGRITALAISPTCDRHACTVWVGAAGGGVWRTDRALSDEVEWKNVSDGFFASGAIGALTYDAAHHTLYAGTGEDAAAGDAEAGVGIYRSTDGGSTWTPLGGNANFMNRAVRQVVVDQNDPTGNTIYVADGRGVHGIASTTAGPVSAIPGGQPGVGIWKSTDGGSTFTLAQPTNVTIGGTTFPSSFASSRGATDVAVDPTHPGIIYAAAYNVGVWRSIDNGTTWTNIHPCSVDPIQPPSPAVPAAGTCGAAADRSEFALATLANGDTRMYQTEGDSGPTVANPNLYSRLFISNGVQGAAPVFTDKTSPNPASPGFATYNFCTGQCWYDQGVYSPPGQPNMVYVFGSFVYAESPDLSQSTGRTPGGISNARGVLLSTDGGETFTDLTEDATSATAPNGLHPDQHDLVTNPSNPLQFFEGSDGGIMLSDGTLADVSARCDSRGLTGAVLARCKQLLSAVPGRYTNLNTGLQTLQFQSLSVNPADSRNIQGGTQDNGTFETQGSDRTWPQTIFGDGGLSGFDATNPHFRVHTYFSSTPEVSFRDGDPSSWNYTGDPIEGNALFYFPIITDPVVSGTEYSGGVHAWRTTDNGGDQAYLEQHCNEFTGDSVSVNPHGTTDAVCGDWVIIGGLTLTGTARGTVHAGGNVSWLARTAADASTLWAATSAGRVLISNNANAADPNAVTFTQIDNLAPNSPGRAISNVFIDPTNSNHAWISYLGYNATTPGTKGHLFSVVYNPATSVATWTSIDGTDGTPGFIGDQPVNSVVEDKQTGDLYASTDFGVMRMAADDLASGWVVAAPGLPVVTVAGLTMNADARQLLAATHGRGAYQLTLAKADKQNGDDNEHDKGKKGGGGGRH